MSQTALQEEGSTARDDSAQGDNGSGSGRQPGWDPDRSAEADSPQANSDSEPTAEPETEGGDSTPDPTAEPLSLDHVFEILKNSRRRQTLQYLYDHDGEATLSDLAEHIAAIENDISVKALSSSQRKRVYVGLYQCHLPKMDGMNVVEFDKNRGTVELGANADQCDQYVQTSSAAIRWPRVYTSVTAGAAGLLAVSMFGGAPLGLTPTVVMIATLAAIALCSALHSYAEPEETADD